MAPARESRTAVKSMNRVPIHTGGSIAGWWVEGIIGLEHSHLYRKMKALSVTVKE